jgi:DNA methylase
MIADNRLVDLSTFNEVKLGELFQEISTLPELDIEDTGFDLPEIELLINGAAPLTGADAADQNIETPVAIAVSQLGDSWHLDDHRVICGDARDLPTVRTLMDRKRASASFLDVPYNVRVHGHVGGKGLIQHREFAMASGEMSPEQYREFLGDALELIARFSADGSVHFICIDWRHLVDASAACADAFETQLNLCTWVKTNAGMGSFYRSQHELILVYKKGTASHRNNIQLGKYGRARSNVWNYPGANSFARSSEEGNLLALHPTVKPVQLVADAILDCTTRGEIVLDTFLGSGSTLIAAERTGRVLYGTEIDPLYVDVIIRRWQRHTGGYATHALTGQRFDDIAAVKDMRHD